MVAALKRIYNGKIYSLISANNGTLRPFSRKADAKAKAKFYKSHDVFKNVIVAPVAGGYVLYAR